MPVTVSPVTGSSTNNNNNTHQKQEEISTVVAPGESREDVGIRPSPLLITHQPPQSHHHPMTEFQNVSSPNNNSHFNFNGDQTVTSYDDNSRQQSFSASFRYFGQHHQGGGVISSSSIGHYGSKKVRPYRTEACLVSSSAHNNGGVVEHPTNSTIPSSSSQQQQQKSTTTTPQQEPSKYVLVFLCPGEYDYHHQERLMYDHGSIAEGLRGNSGSLSVMSPCSTFGVHNNNDDDNTTDVPLLRQGTANQFFNNVNTFPSSPLVPPSFSCSLTFMPTGEQHHNNNPQLHDDDSILLGGGPIHRPAFEEACSVLRPEMKAVALRKSLRDVGGWNLRDQVTHHRSGALRRAIRATSYSQGVSGRHLMLHSANGTMLWKMALSPREELFYRRIYGGGKKIGMKANVLAYISHTAADKKKKGGNEELGDNNDEEVEIEDEEGNDDEEEDRNNPSYPLFVAPQLLPFVPTFYGVYGVCKLEAMKDATPFTPTGKAAPSTLPQGTKSVDSLQQQQPEIVVNSSTDVTIISNKSDVVTSPNTATAPVSSGARVTTSLVAQHRDFHRENTTPPISDLTVIQPPPSAECASGNPEASTDMRDEDDDDVKGGSGGDTQTVGGDDDGNGDDDDLFISSCSTCEEKLEQGRLETAWGEKYRYHRALTVALGTIQITAAAAAATINAAVNDDTTRTGFKHRQPVKLQCMGLGSSCKHPDQSALDELFEKFKNNSNSGNDGSSDIPSNQTATAISATLLTTCVAHPQQLATVRPRLDRKVGRSPTPSLDVSPSGASGSFPSLLLNSSPTTTRPPIKSSTLGDFAGNSVVTIGESPPGGEGPCESSFISLESGFHPRDATSFLPHTPPMAPTPHNMNLTQPPPHRHRLDPSESSGREDTTNRTNSPSRPHPHLRRSRRTKKSSTSKRTTFSVTLTSTNHRLNRCAAGGGSKTSPTTTSNSAETLSSKDDDAPPRKTGGNDDDDEEDVMQPISSPVWQQGPAFGSSSVPPRERSSSGSATMVIDGGGSSGFAEEVGEDNVSSTPPLSPTSNTSSTHISEFPTHRHHHHHNHGGSDKKPQRHGHHYRKRKGRDDHHHRHNNSNHNNTSRGGENDCPIRSAIEAIDCVRCRRWLIAFHFGQYPLPSSNNNTHFNNQTGNGNGQNHHLLHHQYVDANRSVPSGGGTYGGGRGSLNACDPGSCSERVYLSSEAPDDNATMATSASDAGIGNSTRLLKTPNTSPTMRAKVSGGSKSRSANTPSQNTTPPSAAAVPDSGGNSVHASCGTVGSTASALNLSPGNNGSAPIYSEDGTTVAHHLQPSSAPSILLGPGLLKEDGSSSAGGDCQQTNNHHARASSFDEAEQPHHPTTGSSEALLSRSPPSTTKHHDLPIVYDNTREHNNDHLVDMFNTIRDEEAKQQQHGNIRSFDDGCGGDVPGTARTYGRHDGRRTLSPAGGGQSGSQTARSYSCGGGRYSAASRMKSSYSTPSMATVSYYLPNDDPHPYSPTQSPHTTPQEASSLQPVGGGGEYCPPSSYPLRTSSSSEKEPLACRAANCPAHHPHNNNLKSHRTLPPHHHRSASTPTTSYAARVAATSSMTMQNRHHSQPDDEHSVGSGGHLSSTPPLEPSQYNQTDTEDDTTTMGDSGTNQHSHTNSVLPRIYQYHNGNNAASAERRRGGGAANHHNHQPPNLMCIGTPQDDSKDYHCCSCIGCEPPVTKNFALNQNEEDDDGEVDFIQSLHMSAGGRSAPPPLPPKSVTGMIVIEDCCKGMRKPCVLDLKMGTRQYGLNPTEEKKASKTAKARKSTTGSLGVRIGGMKAFIKEEEQRVGNTTSTSTTDTSAASFQLKRIEKKVGMAMSKETFSSSILDFATASSSSSSTTLNDVDVSSPLIVQIAKQDDVVDDGCDTTTTTTITTTVSLQQRFVELLEEFRAAFASQNDFRFFTSSLLMVYDADAPTTNTTTPRHRILTPAAASAKLVMIDFAFTYHVDELRANGDEDGFTSCDEGYVKGIDSLIRILKDAQ